MKILHVEDNSSDAELIRESLVKAGLSCDITRTQTVADYLALLEQPDWDLILSDFALRSFSGLSALELAVKKHPDVPFIFVSGVPGEDIAVETLKTGASDYVFKNNLVRLAFVVVRARRETDLLAREKDAAHRNQEAQALIDSDLQFQTTADAIPQLAWMANPDGFIFWYNKRWYGFTGTTPEQMEGWGWQSVHDPVHLPSVLEHWMKSIAAETPFEMRFPLRRADGVFRWFLTLIFPIRDARECVSRWLGTTTDITDIGLAREVLAARERQTRTRNDELETRVRERTSQLHESEKRYRTPIDNIHDYSILLLDENGDFVNWNSSSERMTGYIADEIVGQNISTLYPPEDIVAGVPGALMQEAAAKGHVEHEHLLVRKDGTRFWASGMITSLKDEAGVVRGFSRMTREVSERKRSAELLEEQMRKLAHQAALLDLAQDAIFVRKADSSSRIEFWSSGTAGTYGWTTEQALCRSSLELLQTVVPKPLRAIEDEIKPLGQWKGEIVQTKANGQTIHVASRWVLQRDRLGFPEFVLEIDRDVSKNAERELRETNERLNLALRAGQVGIWKWDFTDNSLTSDERTAVLFGFSGDTGTQDVSVFLNHIHPGDLDRIHHEITRHG